LTLQRASIMILKYAASMQDFIHRVLGVSLADAKALAEGEPVAALVRARPIVFGKAPVNRTQSRPLARSSATPDNAEASGTTPASGVVCRALAANSAMRL
jgi:hypothetical protein